MTYEETDQLADLITKKQQCLIQLYELAQRQSVLIDSSDMTQLLKVLAAKQHLIEAVRVIEKQLEPFHRQDPDARRWRSPEDRARCADHAAACGELLKQVMEMEKESERTLQAKRNRVAHQLEAAHAGGLARGAYHAQERPDEMTRLGMLDLTSDA